jgi:hypothetical protein
MVTEEKMLELAIERAEQARKKGRLSSVTAELFRIQGEQKGSQNGDQEE